MANKPYLDSNDLIKSIRLRAMIPTNNKTFDSENFLSFANEEMDMGMIPLVLTMHEDYLMYSEDFTIDPDHPSIAIPSRAVGNKLRDVSYVDASNNIYSMKRILVEDLSSYNYNYNSNTAYFYFVQNNEIKFYPTNVSAGNGKVRLTYYLRPNRLVLLEKIGVISSIDRLTGQIVLSNIPTEFNTGELFDFIQTNSPHKSLGMNVSLSGISSSTKTVTLNPDDIPYNLSVGDHLALAQQSAIPQVPSDLHPMLAHRVACRCLEALGDAQGLQAANAKLIEMEAKTQHIIDSRVEGSPLKVIARSNPLRRGLSFRRNRRY